MPLLKFQPSCIYIYIYIYIYILFLSVTECYPDGDSTRSKHVATLKIITVLVVSTAPLCSTRSVLIRQLRTVNQTGRYICRSCTNTDIPVCVGFVPLFYYLVARSPPLARSAFLTLVSHISLCDTAQVGWKCFHFSDNELNQCSGYTGSGKSSAVCVLNLRVPKDETYLNTYILVPYILSTTDDKKSCGYRCP